jgi:hypothetical protein
MAGCRFKGFGEVSMFDSLVDREQGKSHTRERLRLVVMVLLIAVILFAVLYFAAQELS